MCEYYKLKYKRKVIYIIYTKLSCLLFYNLNLKETKKNFFNSQFYIY